MRYSGAKIGLIGAALAALTMTVATPALAAKPKLIGIYKKWEAYNYTENGAKVCYMGSQPINSKGKYTKRGPVYVMVTHRPGVKLYNEVSFVAGYTFRANSDLLIDIDKKKFKLFTDKDTAWAANAETDRDLVRFMRKGARMVAKGTSSRGTATTDTYSLSGFTAAYNAISKACNAKPVK